MSSAVVAPSSDTAAKVAFYDDVCEQLAALLDPVLPTAANLANAASLLHHALVDPPSSRPINWTGFYLATGDLRPTPGRGHGEPVAAPATAAAGGDGKNASAAAAAAATTLVLGPFQGRVACTVIPFGRGVCGAAAATRRAVVVGDVHAFPGHIACDGASASEVVVPLLRADGTVAGVVDVDCSVRDGFDDADADGIGRFARVVMDVVRL
ncbi:hypothetical protein HK405_000009 [Cladochytrium tenue]|nr:hypothetical protein HK405_000009 [Cladochytrium tenue]